MQTFDEIKTKLTFLLHCEADDISDISDMHAGMTNESYLFKYGKKKYIYRKPGKGSSGLVNRAQEADAYKAIRWLGISDNVIYYDKRTGIKISEYVEHARVADGMNINESIKCLLFAKHNLHDKCKVTKHKIDIIDMIEKYEKLMKESEYADYEQTKARVLYGIKYWQKRQHKYCLCHFDLNPDNFLLTKSGKIILLDWEYAGMNDPIYDLAGWIVYKRYDEKQIHDLVVGYLEHEPTRDEMQKVYACIAAMGLLWSNWCEYKKHCGQDFGDYALQQYEYARKYSNA